MTQEENPKQEAFKKTDFSGVVPMIFKILLSFLVALGFVIVTLFGISKPQLIEIIRVPRAQIQYLEEGGSQFKSQDSDSWSDISGETKLKEGDVIRTNTELGIFFFGDGVLRLAPGTEIELAHFGKEPEVGIKLKKGNLWVSSYLSRVEFNIFTDKLIAVSKNAVFDIGFANEEVSLYVDKHAVKVGFLKSNSDLTPLLLNHFLITENNFMKIEENRIDDRISNLRYSKLMKEFPPHSVSKEEFEKNSWWSSNRERTESYYARIRSERAALLSDMPIEDSWLTSLSPSIQRFYRKMSQFLTFDPNKRLNFEVQIVFNNWMMAVSLLNQGKDPGFSLESFKRDLENLDLDNEAIFELVSNILNQNMVLASFVLPDSSLYKAKDALRQAKLEILNSDEKFSARMDFLRDKLFEVYDLVGQKRYTQAKSAFLEYARELQQVLKDNEAAKDILVEERWLIHHLVASDVQFYDVSYFKVISVLERQILDMTDDKAGLDEALLTFISDKLATLSRLISLVKSEDLDLAKAVKLGDRLVQESQRYSSETATELAVTLYFEEQLREFQSLLDFFNSPYYEALQGVFDNGIYEMFLVEQEDLREKTQEYIKSEQSKPKVYSRRSDVDKIIADIKSSFEKAGMKINDVESQGDAAGRLYYLGDIKYRNAEISARYDAETAIVYDIEVNGEMLSSGARIENLPLILDGQLGLIEKKEESVEVSEEEEKLKRSERVALTLLQNHLKGLGITTDISNLKVVDLDGKLFEVLGAKDASNEQISFSFDYDYFRNEASNITVDTVSGEKIISSAVSNEALLERVREVYENAG